MKALNLAGAAAIALTFGTTMALAQSQPQVGDGSNTKPMSTTTPGYNIGTGSAHVGGGGDTKPVPTTTPGYNVGTGSAQIGDGSNTRPLSTTTPGYSTGTAAAHKKPAQN